MKQAERDAILREGITLPETPESRCQLSGLGEDIRSLADTGKPMRIRLRNFRSSAEAYLASAGGPLPYMLRLRVIEQQTAQHESALAQVWHELADECAGDPRRFWLEWSSEAGRWSFDETNELIERHNRWYPVESRLAMDPRTGDYVLVSGSAYRLEPLDAEWVLERFPPDLTSAPVSVP